MFPESALSPQWSEQLLATDLRNVEVLVAVLEPRLRTLHITRELRQDASDLIKYVGVGLKARFVRSVCPAYGKMQEGANGIWQVRFN